MPVSTVYDVVWIYIWSSGLKCLQKWRHLPQEMEALEPPGTGIGAGISLSGLDIGAKPTIFFLPKQVPV
jgi:hypothetical protein